ncbi:MAG: hypothetical protein HYU64_07470, partial [Armatimonadetes bacterium]|nr:hypothetical protein [Armatimonadota bacterium]
PSGRILPIPIKASLREGLTVLEYFISTHGARKGLADTALRTADSGYLTRRLIDVAQDIIVREVDCGSTEGITVQAVKEGSVTIVPLRERIQGRIAAEDVTRPKKKKEVIVRKGEDILDETAEKIEEIGVESVKIRSVLTCRAAYGVCIKCYGRNLATGKPVDIGETVGIIAAQSIGEPGTQLTLRTFHTGGVATEDIIQGLPRVEELFEARKPKGHAVITETEGVVKLGEEKGLRKITIQGVGDEERVYLVPFSGRLKVRNGAMVQAGDQLTEGSVNPHEILRIKGVTEVQRYLVNEVQSVYRSQGVDINDKHIEVIVRQMLRKVRVDDSGDAEMLPGSLVDIHEFSRHNEQAVRRGGEPGKGSLVLLGVTKASLATDSVLSAASFQETTRVLTDAAIKGKTDPLLGLKENVIIGKLIPAGTGMMRYRNIELFYEEPPDEEEEAPKEVSQAPEEKLEVTPEEVPEEATVEATVEAAAEAEIEEALVAPALEAPAPEEPAPEEPEPTPKKGKGKKAPPPEEGRGDRQKEEKGSGSYKRAKEREERGTGRKRVAFR